jgi:hypothetical protein
MAEPQAQLQATTTDRLRGMIDSMLSRDRQRRALVLAALDRRARQFRSRADSWPFRMPHDPLDLDAVIASALAEEGGSVAPDALRSRGVLRLEWAAGDVWDLWVIVLPSGLHLFCDSDGRETRVLASARRGNPAEADGFFLERLAESRGHLFGIEMAGGPPDRVKSSIGDREFLADVFVELFEGTAAESHLKEAAAADSEGDFRTVVVRWLEAVLSAPPMTRRQPRVRDEDPAVP